MPPCDRSWLVGDHEERSQPDLAVGQGRGYPGFSWTPVFHDQSPEIARLDDQQLDRIGLPLGTCYAHFVQAQPGRVPVGPKHHAADAGQIAGLVTHRDVPAVSLSRRKPRRQREGRDRVGHGKRHGLRREVGRGKGLERRLIPLKLERFGVSQVAALEAGCGPVGLLGSASAQSSQNHEPKTDGSRHADLLHRFSPTARQTGCHARVLLVGIDKFLPVTDKKV